MSTSSAVLLGVLALSVWLFTLFKGCSLLFELMEWKRPKRPQPLRLVQGGLSDLSGHLSADLSGQRGPTPVA